MKINEFDNMTRYCRFLGHHVPFSYCRQCNNTLFCKSIVDCWTGKIKITSFLQYHFTEEERAQALRPSLPKTVTLFEQIQKAKRNISNESGSGDG